MHISIGDTIRICRHDGKDHVQPLLRLTLGESSTMAFDNRVRGYVLRQNLERQMTLLTSCACLDDVPLLGAILFTLFPM